MRKVWPTVLLVALILVSLPYILRLTPEEIVRLTPESALLATIVILGLYVLKTVTVFMPQVILYIAAGLLFTPLWAVMVTLMGMLIEFTLGYHIGRMLGKDNVLKRMQSSHRGRRVLQMCEANDTTSAFLPRFIPTPTDLGSMFFGAIGMDFTHFLQGSFLGLLPRAIPYVLLGDSFHDTRSVAFIIAVSAIVVVYAIGAVMLYQMKKGKQAR